MSIKKSVSLLIATASLGLGIVATAHTQTQAATYHSIPKSLHGYYIGYHRLMVIRSHTIAQGKPQADVDTSHVTKVSRSGHYYRFHCWISLGTVTHFTVKLSHYGHNKIYVSGSSLHKVSKSRYYWYANHGITG
ncbi:hypothetical protein OF387_01430 [Lentilactobacillus hilgardii]|nr:hypothetical protein [Lentilactobacillus hilgardii]MCV3739879.1 hypothetical protein [Lentilactobacillus hilgardii]